MELDTVVCGDCLDVLPTIPDASIDAVITDPPYPHIKRDYGYWTTTEWWALMVDGVIPQVRRILKPTGSAVFILQPNSEKVGKMRGWLWEFMAWACREWNMVQDVWWWNITAMPSAGATTMGLMRPSIKACVWIGTPGCYRQQKEVLWDRGDWHISEKHAARVDRIVYPSGHSKNPHACVAAYDKRGGVTPFNILPIANQHSKDTAGDNGHGAGTPLALADWWLRYIVPPGGVVLDPFIGSGTTALAAIKQGKHFMGIDKVPAYVEIANRRIVEAAPAQAEMVL